MFSKNSVVGVVAGVAALAMGTALGDEKIVLRGIVILDVDRTITCGAFADAGKCVNAPAKSSANVFRKTALGGSPSPVFCHDGAYYMPDTPAGAKQKHSYGLKTGRGVKDFLNQFASPKKGWLTAIASHSGSDLTELQKNCTVSKYDFVRQALNGHTEGMGTDCTKLDSSGNVQEGAANNLCVHSPWLGKDNPGANKDVMVKYLLKSLDHNMEFDKAFTEKYKFGDTFEVRFIDDEVANHKAVLLDQNNNAQVYQFNTNKTVSSTCAFYPNQFTEDYQGSPECGKAQKDDKSGCTNPVRKDDKSVGIQSDFFYKTLLKMHNHEGKTYRNPSSKEEPLKKDPLQSNCNPDM